MKFVEKIRHIPSQNSFVSVILDDFHTNMNIGYGKNTHFLCRFEIRVLPSCTTGFRAISSVSPFFKSFEDEKRQVPASKVRRGLNFNDKVDLQAEAPECLLFATMNHLIFFG